MIRFCCGVIAFVFAPAMSYQYWWLLFALTLVLALLGVWIRISRAIFPLCLGLAYSAGYAFWGCTHILPLSLEREPIVVSGSVDSIPQIKGDHCSFVLSVDAFSSLDDSVQQAVNDYKPRQIQLNWYQCDEAIKTGQQWQFEVRLKQPHSLANDGGFDFERSWFSQSIDARGYIKKATLLKNPKWGLSTQWRSRLIEKLSTSGVNPVSLPILKAILFGDKNDLTRDYWTVLRETGLVHLVIVSGLHIGLVSGFIVLILLTLLRAFPFVSIQRRRLITVMTAIICAALYAFLAGFTLPTQRALIMTVLVLMSWLSVGQFDVLKRLSIAMAFVLLLDPLSVLSAGFWLSFGATAMLLHMINCRIASRSKLVTALQFQCGLFLFSLPLLAYWFYQVPLVSALFNTIAVPLVGFLLLPLSLLGMILWVLFESGSLLFYVAEAWAHCWQFLSYQTEIISYQWSVPQPSWLAVFLALFAALWLMGPKAIPAKPMSLLLWLPLVFVTEEELLPAEFTVKVFDVGQGLSVFIQTQHHNLLYDTGASFGDDFSIASMTLIPALKREGVGYLDKLVVSHGDNDHSGGVAHVRQAFDIGEFVGGRNPASLCQSGQKWLWDQVVFEFLHPDSKKNYDSNNQSCVLKVSSINGSLLLTGDIESGIEHMLVRKYPHHLRSDVLIVPHHGSKTSSTQRFVKAVDPIVAVNSAGYLNRYKHPHYDVVGVYNDLGVRFLNTAESGQINVFFGMKKTPEFSQFRQVNAAYWRR